MKHCNGCKRRCELGYSLSGRNTFIAPRVGDETFWEYDIYASGVRRVLFTKFVGTATQKEKLKLLMRQRAKDIARYCDRQR